MRASKRESDSSSAGASSTTATIERSLATTSAVAGTSSSSDISPTHAPGVVTFVIGVPAFSMRSAPSTSTYSAGTGRPSTSSTSPRSITRRGRPSAISSRSATFIVSRITIRAPPHGATTRPACRAAQTLEGAIAALDLENRRQIVSAGPVGTTTLARSVGLKAFLRCFTAADSQARPSWNLMHRPVPLSSRLPDTRRSAVVRGETPCSVPR